MVKTAVAFLFYLTSTIANAQSEKYFESVKPVICDETRSVIKGLMEKWGELPVWTAVDAKDSSRYLLLVNPKKGNWTLLQHNAEFACILGVGNESTLANTNKNTL